MPESLNRLSPHAVSRAASRWSSAAVRRRRRTARARRLGVALSAVLAATLLPAEAWAIAPPAPRSGPVLDALQQEEPADPDQAKMEELSAWSGSAVEPPTVFDPTAITPPAGGTAPVTLDGAGEDLVPVGTLPVSIGKASPTEAEPNPPAPSGTWDVAVEPRTSTEAADVDGALITVTPPESGSTPVDIELDYGQFEDLFGISEWSSRLKLTQLPQCFLTTPELEECTTPSTCPAATIRQATRSAPPSTRPRARRRACRPSPAAAPSSWPPPTRRRRGRHVQGDPALRDRHLVGGRAAAAASPGRTRCPSPSRRPGRAEGRPLLLLPVRRRPHLRRQRPGIVDR